MELPYQAAEDGASRAKVDLPPANNNKRLADLNTGMGVCVCVDGSGGVGGCGLGVLRKTVQIESRNPPGVSQDEPRNKLFRWKLLFSSFFPAQFPPSAAFNDICEDRFTPPLVPLPSTPLVQQPPSPSPPHTSSERPCLRLAVSCIRWPRHMTAQTKSPDGEGIYFLQRGGL